MKVALGGFARSGIETRFGADLGAGVQAAARHYTRRLRSGKPPVAVPRFCCDGARRASDGAPGLEIPLSPEVERALQSEADKTHLPLDQILAHAVFVFLADMDAAGAAGTIGISASR